MTDRRYLLLGESPNAATVGRPDLWLLPDDSGIPHTANNLLRHIGWDIETYERTFVRDNLLHDLPPRGGKGRTFPLAQRQENASRIIDLAAEETVHGVVLLGRRVASVFRFASRGDTRSVSGGRWPWLSWAQAWPQGEDGARRMHAAVVPHPSGINQWWNDPANRCGAHAFFGSLICSE